VITTVLCDLDGTLIDSRQDIIDAFHHAIRQVTQEPLPPAERVAQVIGKPLVDMAHALGVVLTPAQQATFLAAYRAHYATHCVRATRAYPGVRDTLQKLADLTLGVVTTKLQEQAELVLTQLNLARFFRHIQGGTPGLRLKPAPDTILVALQRLGQTAAQTLMVGDTSADMQAGKAAGVRTCAVTYGFGDTQALLDCGPDYCIRSFPELLSVLAHEATQS
jgi:HAD superfamily hydrolase (TIGR01509 family)